MYRRFSTDMWMLGYHFKWRTVMNVAKANNIHVSRPELLSTAVENFVHDKSRVNFWVTYDWDHRPIITFHEHEDQRDPTGVRFNEWHVLRVAQALKMDRAPRWYTDEEGLAYQEAESSDDDEMNWGLSKRNVEVESDSDDDSEDGGSENADTLDGDIENGDIENGDIENSDIENSDIKDDDHEDERYANSGPYEDSVGFMRRHEDEDSFDRRSLRDIFLVSLY
ncbi:hypothetical protein DFH11DRAFT_1750105 [Phellopilus nigrolimitatus]|nr:hypothetical protein DFH11DRAFT_1751379 [Phellopilus nigrolimitatus]KAH8103223.1 hypothetical protein DFH11DRAFT_1750105 [Phellopilus nigrolimitatus]